MRIFLLIYTEDRNCYANQLNSSFGGRGGHEMERPGEDTRWRDQGRTQDGETRGGH